MNHSLGRYVYGLAAIALGVCAVVWHDIDHLHQLKALADSPYRAILAEVVGGIEILGGVAIFFPRTVRAGAVAVGAIYFIFAALGIPYLLKHPLIYNSYGNIFEQFSFVSGALILYARSGPLARFGYYSFGICVMSFALEQLFYLPETAILVPKWIPPGQMFWAIATTGAFALASVALLTGFMARLASILTTAMLAGFGLLVWAPALVTAPSSFQNCSESATTLAVIASAWVVADFLGLKSTTLREVRGAPWQFGG